MQGLWSFAEIKFVHACSRGMDASEIADELNTRYHEGRRVRSAAEVNKLKGGKSIFTFEERRKNNGENEPFI